MSARASITASYGGDWSAGLKSTIVSCPYPQHLDNVRGYRRVKIRAHRASRLQRPDEIDADRTGLQPGE